MTCVSKMGLKVSKLGIIAVGMPSLLEISVVVGEGPFGHPPDTQWMERKESETALTFAWMESASRLQNS